MRKLFIAGNWKMNNNIAETKAFFKDFISLGVDFEKVDVAFSPVYTSITAAQEACSMSRIYIGAQNMHYEDKGAFTGEISAHMLNELEVDFVILGHSERRHVFLESNKLIAKKVEKAISVNLLPILCVGEKLEEREAEKTETVVKEQIDSAFNNLSADDAMKVIIAYEPVWAIGTGKTATPKIAESVHFFIRNRIKELYNSLVADKIRILYGGSVKPDNAKSLLGQPNIDGALVGGASLKPEVFAELINNSLEA